MATLENEEKKPVLISDQRNKSTIHDTFLYFQALVKKKKILSSSYLRLWPHLSTSGLCCPSLRWAVSLAAGASIEFGAALSRGHPGERQGSISVHRCCAFRWAGAQALADLSFLRRYQNSQRRSYTFSDPYQVEWM